MIAKYSLDSKYNNIFILNTYSYFAISLNSLFTFIFVYISVEWNIFKSVLKYTNLTVHYNIVEPD